MKSLGRIFDEVIYSQERRWNEHIQQVGQSFGYLMQMAREREQRTYNEAQYEKKREDGFIDAERRRKFQRLRSQRKLVPKKAIQDVEIKETATNSIDQRNLANYRAGQEKANVFKRILRRFTLPFLKRRRTI